MEILLTGLGLSPLFAARPLLSLVTGAFTLGVVLTLRQDEAPRFGSVLLALAALALAAVVEMALKSARRRVEGLLDTAGPLFSLIDRAVAVGAGVLLTGMLLGTWGASFLRQWFSGAVEPGTLPTHLAGLPVQGLILGAVGLSIGGFHWGRERLSGTLSFLPWSAEPSIRRLYRLLEMAVCGAGAIAAVVWPGFAAVLFAVCATTTAVSLALLRGFDARQRTVCDTCGVKVHRCAQHCPSCTRERVPSRLGLFGRARAKQVEDLAAHRLQLLGARRCHRCAEPFGFQGTSDACGHCGTPVFPDAELLARFLTYADKRYLALVPVLALLGLVPLLGTLLGLWLYGVSPAGALGAYARWQHRVSSQMLRELAMLGMVVLQPLPVVGAALVPALVGVLHAQSRLAVRIRPEARAEEAAPAAAPALQAAG
jgi:hypothetical protein